MRIETALIRFWFHVNGGQLEVLFHIVFQYADFTMDPDILDVLNEAPITSIAKELLDLRRKTSMLPSSEDYQDVSVTANSNSD